MFDNIIKCPLEGPSGRQGRCMPVEHLFFLLVVVVVVDIVYFISILGKHNKEKGSIFR